MSAHSATAATAGRLLFDGRAIQCSRLDGDIIELRFDLRGDSVNKFNKATLTDLGDAIAAVRAERDVKGLLVTSGKECFIVGADVTEFLAWFASPEEQLIAWIGEVH